jgi:hypothetical protein
MIEVAGEKIDFIAFHHMYNPGQNITNSPLHDNEYRKDPAGTWEILMNGYKMHEAKINAIRDEVSPFRMPLALTECHYAIPGRNRCEVLSSWAAGVSYARLMNLHERNGDLLKIATLADFCGTRWQVNAIMIPVPSGRAFMKYSGKDFINVTGVPSDLDVTASRSGNKIFLHVVNTNRVRQAMTSLQVDGQKISSARAFEICTNPEFEILSASDDPMKPKERSLALNEPVTFPGASVTAVELTIS